MRLLFRPEAAAELLEAQSWYELQAPGLGSEFTRMADAAIAAICRNSEGYPCIEASFRRILFRRFPYMFIYETDGENIVVVACFHQRRKPGAWAARLTEI